MTTNITKLEQLYSMRPHTAAIVDDLLSNYLPHGYSSKIVNRAKNLGINTYAQWVRSVKSLLKEDIQILNLLIELAKEEKTVAEVEKEKLKSLTIK